jgi:hypothetical protein
MLGCLQTSGFYHKKGVPAQKGVQKVFFFWIWWTPGRKNNERTESEYRVSSWPDAEFYKGRIGGVVRQRKAAIRRGDDAEFERLCGIIPADPDIAMAFKEVYGKEYLLELGLDLTEADLKFGDGWLDGSNE